VVLIAKFTKILKKAKKFEEGIFVDKDCSILRESCYTLFCNLLKLTNMLS